VRVAIPTILVNCVDPNAGLASVAPDEHGAGSEAARVLMEAGHTQIGVVAGPPDTMQDRLRVAGIQAEAAPAHVIVSVQTAPNRDIGAGFDAARTLLSAPGVATALICTHERLAIGARLAAADLGLAIPADMSIVSLDDGELLASRLVPQMTTIERPDRAMAEEAVTVTLQRLDEEGGAPIRQLSFSCLATNQDSVARPRRSDRRPHRRADRR
jgi:LacI family transcriptional regulator, galactose operon repressor